MMLSHNSQAVMALSTNKQRVLVALKTLHISDVMVRYYGSSDEGDITEIVLSPPHEPCNALLQTHDLVFSFVRGTFRAEAYHYFLVDKEVSLDEALRLFTLIWVDLHHAGWENNEGGSGVMTISVAEELFSLAHCDYYTKSRDFNYRL